jgi:hypothetical protein
LSALKRETEETTTKMEEDKFEYPRNYLKGKFLPWRNSLQQLGPLENTISVDQKEEKKTQGLGMKFNLLGTKKK